MTCHLHTYHLHPKAPHFELRRVQGPVRPLLLFLGVFLLTAGLLRAEVLTGIDVLEAGGFRPLQGRRVGLITNATGVDRAGRRTLDVLAAAPGVTLLAAFSPEHGLETNLDTEDIASGRDARTGVPVYSLYGKTRRPTSEMLRGIDTLVFDIQDAGARFYTYITTLGYALEEAARAGLRFVVLDRPNPIGGVKVEGPLLDADARSFIGYFPMPVRHGMTVGELARMFNAEQHLGADLTVIPMQGWKREDWYDATGLAWINPSPNLRSLEQAALYPGVGLLEFSNVSVGRGTAHPFEVVGAPWIDGTLLKERLEQRRIPGVRFTAVRFVPSQSVFVGESCEGVRIAIIDREALSPVALGIEMAAALRALYPRRYRLENIARSLGSRETLARLLRGDDPAAIARDWERENAAFLSRRSRYLIY